MTGRFSNVLALSSSLYGILSMMLYPIWLQYFRRRSSCTSKLAPNVCSSELTRQYIITFAFIILFFS